MTGGQLGFGFDEDALVPAAQAAPAKARKPRAAKAVATPPAVLAVPAVVGAGPEAMALALERHPDYRVRRRLVPIDTHASLRSARCMRISVKTWARHRRPGRP